MSRIFRVRTGSLKLSDGDIYRQLNNIDRRHISKSWVVDCCTGTLASRLSGATEQRPSFSPPTILEGMRPIRPLLLQLRQQVACRRYSSVPPPSSSSSSPKPASPHILIYKDFGRPFGKVFVTAVLAYQLLYYSWLKLEKEEEKRDTNAKIADLEEEVRRLQSTR